MQMSWTQYGGMFGTARPPNPLAPWIGPRPTPGGSPIISGPPLKWCDDPARMRGEPCIDPKATLGRFAVPLSQPSTASKGNPLYQQAANPPVTTWVSWLPLVGSLIAAYYLILKRR